MGGQGWPSSTVVGLSSSSPFPLRLHGGRPWDRKWGTQNGGQEMGDTTKWGTRTKMGDTTC
jgi:hypothetical protein